jgi:hypothetical protein
MILSGYFFPPILAIKGIIIFRQKKTPALFPKVIFT